MAHNCISFYGVSYKGKERGPVWTAPPYAAGMAVKHASIPDLSGRKAGSKVAD